MSKMLKNIVLLLMLANLAISQIRSDPDWYCEKRKYKEWEKWVKCRWEGKPEVRDVSEWQMASGTARCSQSESCQLQFQFTTGSEASETTTFKMDVSAMIGVVGQLGVGIENSKTLSTSASRTETMSCNVAPGNEADVWLLVLKKKFRGRVVAESKEWDIGIYRPNSANTFVKDYEVIIPTVDPNSGRLAGPLECRQRPVSDVKEIYFHKNDKPMKEGCELDAANDALDNSLKRVPPRGMNVLSTGSSCGLKVYVRTMCFHLDDPNSYDSKCLSCIKYARTHILSKGSNGYGMNWRLQDCYLRFEFYHFN